ncbi:MAG: AAA domain-containing protein, partial [Turicibacter sp.]
MKQLFEYLLALRNLNYDPIRDIKKYEKYWFLDELPVSVGCYLGGSGTDKEAYLEVHQQVFKDDYPLLSEELRVLVMLLGFDYSKDGSQVCQTAELQTILAEKVRVLTQKIKSGQKEIELDKWECFLTNQNRALIDADQLLHSIVEIPLFIDQLVSSYDGWINKWDLWASEQKRKRSIQKVYDYLFNLMQLFKTEEKPLEIILGTGMLSYTLKHEINHPLLTTKLELIFDAEKGIAKLIPTLKGTQLEMEMLTDLELPNQSEIMKLRDVFKGQLINPFSEEAYDGILSQFIHFMHHNGQYLKCTKSNATYKFPVITNRHLIFVRLKSDLLLKEDLRTTIDYIEEGNKIPKTVKAIVDVDALKLSDQDLKQWQSVGENILFPLPANEEQKDIARRLAENIAITVQGPPGTGKSHTIVNLIAHLLANGKKVLIVSEKDKALRVLLDKLPEEIQPFCVSFLGADAKSLEQIEQSIRYLSEGLATYDIKMLEKEIQVLGRSHDMIRRQINITKHNMIRFRELDAKGISWKDKVCQPYEMAQMVSTKSAQFPWFKDAIAMDVACPLSNEEFVTLWELKCRLPRVHKEIIQYELPLLSDLLSGEEFKALLEKRQVYMNRILELEAFEQMYHFPKNEHFIDQLYTQLELLVNKFEKISDELGQSILQECLLNKERHSVWTAVYDRLNDLLFTINERELMVVNDEVSCEYLNHPKFMTYICAIRDRIQMNKPISGLFLTFN